MKDDLIGTALVIALACVGGFVVAVLWRYDGLFQFIGASRQ